jgi:glutamine---fructose-6-phosphate transaminase (isomerizing)
MKAERFLEDVEAKPTFLRNLADAVESDDPWRGIIRAREVVLLGMGSSRYAARVAATRLRAAGVAAAAEYASVAAGPALASAAGPMRLSTARPFAAVGVSASGTTPETVEALRRHAPAYTVALTNDARSALAEGAHLIVPMDAGVESGGVACRTFQHTLARLLGMEAVLTARALPVSTWIRGAAEATEDLLARRDTWLPPAADLLGDGAATFAIAPVERLASAEQGALMFREGPRRIAAACEAGDWLHVDVYLTKPLDYRALLFAGSRFDGAILEWIGERGGEVVAVGGEVSGAAQTIRYVHDDVPEIALLTEVLIAELVAARWWLAQSGTGG